MIGYVKGTVAFLFADSCMVDVQGVGYTVYIPNSTRQKIAVGDEVLLFTYLQVLQDALTLYGFYTQDEYELFKLLISVNGIGPKAGVGILSAVNPDGFRLAIHQKNISVLTKIPGIGKKTAERLVLELQDKVGAPETAGEDSIEAAAPVSAGGAEQEVLAALMSLGYSAQEVMPVLQKEAALHDQVETLLRAVLLRLGSGR